LIWRKKVANSRWYLRSSSRSSVGGRVEVDFANGVVEGGSGDEVSAE
jgi:hypothetical protein